MLLPLRKVRKMSLDEIRNKHEFLTEIGKMALKERLLARYRESEPHVYLQLDGIHSAPCYDVELHHDNDLDALSGGWTCGLQQDEVPVRIEILEGVPKKDAVRLLRKLVAWLDRDGAESLTPAYYNADAPKEDSGASILQADSQAIGPAPVFVEFRGDGRSGGVGLCEIKDPFAGDSPEDQNGLTSHNEDANA
jgi:hypothetical protein